jgi:hypothetical protein
MFELETKAASLKMTFQPLPPPPPTRCTNGTTRFKNVNICFYNNVYSYLETSGGISSNPYLNAVHFFNIRVN